MHQKTGAVAMILDINLPQRGCFVGLVQRFEVFTSINIGFTLAFLRARVKFEYALNTNCFTCLVATHRHLPQVCFRLKCGVSPKPEDAQPDQHDTETLLMTATTTSSPRIGLDEFLLLLDTHHPFAKVLGIQILEIGYGTATLSLPPNPNFQRLGGIVAGPMLMGLADLAMYAAVVGATGNAEAVTASLTINFMRKSPPGTIYAHARVLKAGRLCSGDVTLTGEGSTEPLAHSVSMWSLPKA